MRHRPDLPQHPQPYGPPFEKDLMDRLATFVPTTDAAKAAMGPDARASDGLRSIDFEATDAGGADHRH